MKTVAPPERLWRVGRQTNPIWFNGPVGVTNIRSDSAGHRYDLIVNPIGTLYVASTPEDAYAESLAPLVPNSEADHLLPTDDTIGKGYVDANYRAARRLCEIELAPSSQVKDLAFVDLGDADNLASLDRELRPALAALHVDRLNLSVVTSPRLSVTHLISEFVAGQLDSNSRRLFAGIRYISKHGANHECWAVYGGINYTVHSMIELAASDPALRKIAKRYGLTVH